MIITFIGHEKTKITEALTQKLQNAIREALSKHKTVFYCGGYGNFDRACAQIVFSLKKEYPQIHSVFVTPYIGDKYEEYLKVIRNSGLYDEIIYPNLENVPPKYAILKRNEYMINSADLIISFVEHTWGGAYTSFCYAKRKKKRIIQLSNKCITSLEEK